MRERNARIVWHSGKGGHAGDDLEGNFLFVQSFSFLAAATEELATEARPDPVADIVTSAARASPISVTPIVNAAQKSQQQMSMAAQRAAQSQGTVPPTDTAGEWLQQAAKRYSAKTKDIGNTLYRRAFKAAGDVSVPAPSATAKIDEMLKGLRANPETNAGAINDLLKLRRDLTRGQTAEQMHQLRSEMSGGVYDGKLRSNTDQGRMKAIRGALTEDLFGFFDKNFMPSISKGIRRADAYHEQRVKQIDEVLQPIVGKDGYKGGEQVVQSIESMARGQQGGNKRLARLMSNMTAPERGEIRSTLVDRLGRASAGQQTAEGEAFSPATFLTNWNRLSPEAKNTLFGGKRYAPQRGALEKLTGLMERIKDNGRFANTSNTAGAMNVTLLLATLSGGVVGSIASGDVKGAGKGAATGAALVLTPRMAAKLITSPRFVEWLAEPLAQTTAGKGFSAASHMSKLAVIAREEPEIRTEIHEYMKKLKEDTR